jgi:hypothetical protein
MYLSGSKSFDPNDEDWPCDTDYLPAERYSNSIVLSEISRSVQPLKDDDVSYLGETFLSLGYVALVLSGWCHGPVRQKLLGDAPMRAIAMGHDSGDLFLLAVLRQE